MKTIFQAKLIYILVKAISLGSIASAQDWGGSACPVITSADKMNILFIGVDNPLSITAPGYYPEDISVTISNEGTIRQISPGKFIANVFKVDLRGETTIQVFAKSEDGSKKIIGDSFFRVKRVPDPVAKIGNEKGGSVKTATFKVQRGIVAELENFDFDVKFQIVSYQMTYISIANNSEITLSAEGSLFTEEMLNQILKCQPGDIFIFDRIKVRAPDGTNRHLQPIVFRLL